MKKMRVLKNDERLSEECSDEHLQERSDCPCVFIKSIKPFLERG